MCAFLCAFMVSPLIWNTKKKQMLRERKVKKYRNTTLRCYKTNRILYLNTAVNDRPSTTNHVVTHGSECPITSIHNPKFVHPHLCKNELYYFKLLIISLISFLEEHMPKPLSRPILFVLLNLP